MRPPRLLKKPDLSIGYSTQNGPLMEQATAKSVEHGHVGQIRDEEWLSKSYSGRLAL